MGDAIERLLEIKEEESTWCGAIVLVIIHQGLSSNNMGSSIPCRDEALLVVTNNVSQNKSKAFRPDFCQNLVVRIDQGYWPVVSCADRFINFRNQTVRSCP